MITITWEDIQRFMTGAIAIALVAAMVSFMREALLDEEEVSQRPILVRPSNAASAIHEVLSTDGYVYIAIKEGCSYCPIAYSMIDVAGIPVEKIVDISNIRQEEEIIRFARALGISSAPALLYVRDGKVIRAIEFTGDIERDREEVKREKAIIVA